MPPKVQDGGNAGSRLPGRAGAYPRGLGNYDYAFQGSPDSFSSQVLGGLAGALTALLINHCILFDTIGD